MNRKHAAAIAGAVLAGSALVYQSTEDNGPVTPAGTDLMVSGAPLGSTGQRASTSIEVSEGMAAAPLTSGENTADGGDEE